MDCRNTYLWYSSIIFLLFLHSCSEESESYYFLEITISEQNQERIIHDPVSSIIFRESDFMYPMLVEVTHLGIFVMDASDDAKVRNYNWEFDLVNKIGKGRGEGPGEIGGVSDIHVSKDTLYITDAVNAFIHVYTTGNEYVRSISIDNEIADQITTLQDILAVRTLLSERPLYIDSHGTVIRKAESISTDDVRYRLILQSRLLSNEEYLFRFPVYFGFMMKYDINGKLILARQLVDAYKAPFDDRTRNPLEQPVGINREEAEIFSVSASLYQDKICVFRFNRVSDERYIDCYDTSGLDYLFSFVPPAGTRDFKIHEDYFVAIHDSSLTVWSWNENNLEAEL